MGIGEEKPFYLETNPSLVLDRLRSNFSFFYLNYIILSVILLATAIMISPTSLLSIALLGGLWFYVMKVTQDGYTIAGVQISNKVATFSMTVVTVLCLVYFLSSVFLWTFSTTALCVFSHSALRDSNSHRDDNDAVEMTGDLEEARFLDSAEE